jgi:hypothetical protein
MERQTSEEGAAPLWSSPHHLALAVRRDRSRCPARRGRHCIDACSRRADLRRGRGSDGLRDNTKSSWKPSGANDLGADAMYRTLYQDGGG